MVFRETDIVIIVAGQCGSGRSTFINALLPSSEPKMSVGESLAVCTSEVDYKIVSLQGNGHCDSRYRNCRLVLVDTPGFNNPDVEDRHIVAQIRSWLEKAYPALNGKPRGGTIYMRDSKSSTSESGLQAEYKLIASLKSAFRDELCFVMTKGDELCEQERVQARYALAVRWAHIDPSLPDVYWHDVEAKKHAEGCITKDGAMKCMHSVWQPFNALVVRNSSGTSPSEKPPVFLPAAIRGDDVLKDARSTDIVIVIMGATNAGKSSFINLLLKHVGDQREVKIGDQQEPRPYDLQFVVIDNQTQRQGSFANLTQENRIVIVDTPGFDDTYRTDFQVSKRTASWLQESLKRKMILGGVVYLHDISQDRFSFTARKNLDMLGSFCEEVSLDKVILVTSKWARQGDRDFGRREQELKTVHWASILRPGDGRQGAKVMRLDGKGSKGEGSSAWAVVRTILGQLDARLSQKLLDDVLQIQEELMMKKRPVPETEAAHELRNQLKEVLRIQEEMLALEASAADGDESAPAKLRERETQLRDMHRAIQQNKITLAARIGSIFKRIFPF